MLEVGTQVTDFELPDGEGNLVSLSDFKGKKVVVYFYPKNNTPGCNAQACGFRDNYSLYEEKGIIVLGISKDDENSHLKFREKFELPFKTLSDQDLDVVKYFGAYGEKTMFGKKYLGVIRSTFVIDENGILVLVLPKVNAKNNALDVIKLIESL